MVGSTVLKVYTDWLAALNERNWDRFTSYLAPDAEFVFTHLLPDVSATLHGRQQIVGSFSGWQARFAELPGTVVDSIQEGNRAAMRLWWSGTTTTGSSIGFASSHWVTIDDSGLITELVDFFDEKGYERQIVS